MDQKAIEADIKNYKIREGPLYKRSKFLKEWRERWVVLTANYLYTFTTKNLDEVTDVIDLKDIKSYKSYLRKDEEMIPPGFKLRTGDDMFYLCAKNCNQKWSWLVSLERLMDYKYVGTSNYNNAEWIKTKGFQSQIQFESGKTKVTPVEPELTKTKTTEQVKKQVNEQADAILKQLEQQQKELDKKKQELQQKQATFVMEQKKIEEEKSKLNQQKKLQQLKQKQKEQKQKQLKQQQAAKQVQQPVKKQQSPVKQSEKKPQVPQQKHSQSTGNQPSVSSLRSLYENRKTEVPVQGPKPVGKIQQKKIKDDINIHRSNAVSELFHEFRNEAAYSNIMKYITDFLINVCADEKCGYAPFVIIEGKSNVNNKNFAEVITELISVFNDYEKCENLMKFIQLCIFQMPGLLDVQQRAKVQNKLKQTFNNLNNLNEQNLALVIKNMFIIHKMKKYQRNDIYAKLDKVTKQSKNQQARIWAQKLRDDL